MWPPGRPPPGALSTAPLPRKGEAARPPQPCLQSPAGSWERRPRETPPCSTKSPQPAPLTAALPAPASTTGCTMRGAGGGNRAFPCPPASCWATPLPVERPGGPQGQLLASDPCPAQGDCFQRETWGRPSVPWVRGPRVRGPAGGGDPCRGLGPPPANTSSQATQTPHFSFALCIY